MKLLQPSQPGKNDPKNSFLGASTAVILQSDRQNDKQTDRMKNRLSNPQTRMLAQYLIKTSMCQDDHLNQIT